MATRDFLLPDLGEGLEDAEIVEWRVAVGDTVLVDQPLLEVETAKANVDVPSPYAGTIVTLHGAPGDRIPVGAALVTFEVAEDTPEPASEPAPERVPASVGVEASGSAPSRPLVGFGATEVASPPVRVGVGADARPSAPETPAPVARSQASSSTGRPTRALASPPVRRRARELGVDLATVVGTGPQGAVTQRDLDQHLESSAASGPPLGGTSSAIPLRGVRRAVAEKMVTSRREIPDASTWVDCDATELLAARERMNAMQHDVKVTPLALVLRACVAGLRRFPRLNARYDVANEQIEELGAVHLGVAVQTDRGLVVPVIRDAHEATTLQLATELQRIATAAREGTLAPAELVGSTFTVSNYGVFGADGGVAIINHPEVAIVGVGRFAKKPWVVDDQVVVRTVVELSLSFDHRVMDGGDAGGFLRFVADCIEHPAVLLAHT